MKLNLLNRRVHYWITPFLALPILVILISGTLLQVKKQFSWVQPPEQRGTGAEPTIDFPQMMQSLREQSDLEVEDWQAVHRIDVRPSRGLAKVSLKSGWEVQIDLGTGRVLQTAIRRSDWIESIHDGSFFAGDWTKLGVFLPTALGLLLLWGTGVWMFFLPLIAKRRKKKRLTAGHATHAGIALAVIGIAILSRPSSAIADAPVFPIAVPDGSSLASVEEISTGRSMRPAGS